METTTAYRERRERENRAVLDAGDLAIKRFFALDQDVYRAAALPAKMKELIGLAASTVLRCNDCIGYHLDRAHAEGASRDEIAEALSIALVVGGSITIPHLRYAFGFLESLESETGGRSSNGSDEGGRADG